MSKLYILNCCSISGLLLVSLITIDLFVLPTTNRLEILENGYAERINRGRTNGVDIYHLKAISKNEYIVSLEAFNGILIGDPFVAKKTLLFKKPAEIEWNANGNHQYAEALHPLKIYLINKIGLVFLLLGGLVFLYLNNARAAIPYNAHAYTIAALSLFFSIYYVAY